MVAVIIAGRPNSEETSECILLAENISNRFPDLKYISVFKHPEEWENYSEEICNLFGFLKNTHPLIFFSNGRLVGGKEDWFKHCEANFKFDFLVGGKLNVDDVIIKNFTQENIKIVNEEYSIRKHGSKIYDKIEELLNKENEKCNLCKVDYDRYNTLDSLYETDYLGEMKVFFKVNSKFRSKNGEYLEFSDPIEYKTLEIDIANKSKRLSMNSQINISNSNSSKEGGLNMSNINDDGNFRNDENLNENEELEDEDNESSNDQEDNKMRKKNKSKIFYKIY